LALNCQKAVAEPQRKKIKLKVFSLVRFAYDP
jgi:hypothetical protein